MDTPTIEVNAWGETDTLRPVAGHYPNDRLAISFVVAEGPFGHLTVNLPDQHLNDGEFFVKSYAESQPLVEACLAAGWIELTGREVPSGFATIQVARPAGPLLEYLKTHGMD